MLDQNHDRRCQLPILRCGSTGIAIWGSMRLHTDASRDDDVIGIGYVIRDDINDIEVNGKQYRFGNFTSMEAEWKAMMTGIHAASWYGDGFLIVLTDCEPLREKMYWPDATSQKWYDMRKKCHKVLNTFEEWKMDVVDRTNNEQAHDLARRAIFMGRDELEEQWKES